MSTSLATAFMTLKTGTITELKWPKEVILIQEFTTLETLQLSSFQQSEKLQSFGFTKATSYQRTKKDSYHSITKYESLVQSRSLENGLDSIQKSTKARLVLQSNACSRDLMNTHCLNELTSISLANHDFYFLISFIHLLR